MATVSRNVWRAPSTEESGGLQSMGLQRVRHNWATNTLMFSWIAMCISKVLSSD